MRVCPKVSQVVYLGQGTSEADNNLRY